MIKQNEVIVGPRFQNRETHVPATIDGATWSTIEMAFRQRMEAVELFLADVAGRFRFKELLSHDSWIVERISVERQYLTSQLPNFQRRISLAAADLVRDSSGQFWFVDDHYSCPLGLYKYSRQLEAAADFESQSEFTRFARKTQEGIRRNQTDDNSTVVLGSSTFNTVYREHRFIAEFLDVPFATRQRLHVEGGKLICANGGDPQRIQTVVRRLQDEDLDSSCYRVDSLQGVRGLVRAAQRGQVRLLNSAGTGLFNHRSICALIPKMIRFYLGTDPVLPTIPTLSSHEVEFSTACANFSNHVFRTDDAMDVRKPLVGSTANNQDVTTYRSRITQDPNSFVARSTVEHASGGAADAMYSLRIFSSGTSQRVILRGGLQRACRQDGTPISSIATDQSVCCAEVEADLAVRR